MTGQGPTWTTMFHGLPEEIGQRYTCVGQMDRCVLVEHLEQNLEAFVVFFSVLDVIRRPKNEKWREKTKQVFEQSAQSARSR